MVNISFKKTTGYIIVIFIIISNISYASWLNYNIEELAPNNIRIHLRWREEDYNKGFVISYYHLTNNRKTLNIGYELREGASTSTYLDFNLASALPPIRINITEMDRTYNMPFEDTKGIEGEQYIKHLHDAGIIRGRDDITFAPFDSITRAEFMVLMIKALEIDIIESSNLNKFTDIDVHWGKQVILTAFNSGLISGYPDNTFRPNNLITVAEASSIISRAFTFKTVRNGMYSKLQQGKWYSNSVKSMFDLRILQVEDSIYKNFNEESFINRADSAIMISRALTTY